MSAKSIVSSQKKKKRKTKKKNLFLNSFIHSFPPSYFHSLPLISFPACLYIYRYILPLLLLLLILILSSLRSIYLSLRISSAPCKSLNKSKSPIPKQIKSNQIQSSQFSSVIETFTCVCMYVLIRMYSYLTSRAMAPSRPMERSPGSNIGQGILDGQNTHMRRAAPKKKTRKEKEREKKMEG